MSARRLLTCLAILGCGCSDGEVGPAGGSAGHAAGTAHEAGSSGSAAGAGGEGSSTAFGTIRLTPNIVAGQSVGSSDVGSSQSGLRVGTASSTTLKSLKYYVSSIQLCENLELVGSGFNNPTGCIALYYNLPDGSPAYDEYTVNVAQTDTTPDRYIDLMTAAGQAALRKPVTPRVPIATATTLDDADGGVPSDEPRPGVYRYGLINFYRPIKVTAEFPIIGEPGQYFRTRAVTNIHVDADSAGGFDSERVEIGNTLSGPTEETTYMLNNGGALFVFQKPFTITQADVAANTEIKVDLVFNPEQFGQAYTAPGCQNQPYVSVCDPVNGVAIDMPFVRMNPVPRKAGEKTRKEVYMLDYEQHAKLRIELYYNDADPEAGIQGVDTALVYSATVTMANAPSNKTIASNFVAQTGSVTRDNARVSLLDYRHETNLSGLLRRRNGTATVHCQFTGSLCPSVGAELTRAYTYEGDVIVSSD